MKILQVSPNFPFPPNDGGKIVIYNFYRHFKKTGNAIDFICINKNPVSPEQREAFDPEKIPDPFYDRNISSYLRVLKNVLLRRSALIYKFYSGRFMNIIMDKIAGGDYDIIHFESLHSVPYALKVKRAFRDKKIVVRLHNIESQIVYRYFKVAKNPVLRLFFYNEFKMMKKLEGRLYREIKNTAFITEEDMKIALSENSSDLNPYVMTAGVDIEHFANLEGNDLRSLLYLGSMDWKPNEDAVLWFIKNVFSNLLETCPDLKFYVVGKNPSERMKKQASSNIIVTGTVEDVRPYIEKSGICVIPLRVGGGMRVKILELMASGKPIITSTIGAEGIEYEPGKDLLIADTAEDFIREIKNLIGDKPKISSIGLNARQKVQTLYSWASVISGYLEYLRKTVL